MNEIILETSAFFISMFCLYDCLRHRRHLYLPAPKGLIPKLSNQHFVYMSLLITTMISASTSVLEVIFEEYLAYKNAIALIILNQGYFLFHNALAALFTLYIIDMLDMGQQRKKKWFYVLIISPVTVMEIITLLNPVTKMVYDINDRLEYVRGDYVWILYATGGIYFLLGLVFYMFYRHRLSKMDRSATLLLIMVAVLGVAIQGIWSIMVELFFEATGLLGFLLLLEGREQHQKKGKLGRRLNKNFIVVISMIFLTVVVININLIYSVGTDQTGKIGSIQIDNIKGSLQETISDAESSLLRVSMGIDQYVDPGLKYMREKYIENQKKYYYDLTGGNCFNVYAASPEWTYIPDFDMPEHYHAVERVWYTGAVQNPSQVFISEPYIDAATGELCFTLSYLLSDKRTVAAMDFTLSKIQDTVRQMSRYEEQTALIVTSEGTIVGCSDVTKQGQILQETMPEYLEIFERVKASREHQSFTTSVAGHDRIVFSNETSNEWQMILIVDSATFYSDIYRQMVMVGTIDLLMVVVIVVFYLVSINNQEKAENTLASAENFILSLSDDLTIPVNEIIHTSDRMLQEGSPGSTEALREIRETGKRLRLMMDNLLSYSSILRSNAENADDDLNKGGRKLSLSSRLIRNGIIAILTAALTIGLVLCVTTSAKWGKARIGREADKYNSELTQWVTRNQSILRMFTDVISATPGILDDYDEAVGWLNDISKNYSEFSYCYIGNPYRTDFPVIMNNGWVPEPDYAVETRQWYKDTERSGDGYSISAPYFDAQTGLYCITFSRIVYSKDGDFLGIFAIDCYLDKLINVLDDSYGSSGYAFLVDRDGNIINHPNKEYEISADNVVNIEDTKYAEAYHKGELFGMKDYDGSYVSCFAQKSDVADFTVIVVQRWWSVYGNVIIMAVIFLIMLFVATIAVIAMISHFITWQEETNAKLVKAAESAVAAGKAKSRFLAQMSHEIRTPINAVLGMNEMILRESDEPDIREYAGNIQTAGRTLLGLINSILDFSKIEEGKMEIIPVKYETAAMMNNLIHSVDQRAADKGLLFETHIDENLPSALFGDDMRISQVVVNLLTNAVKYTAEGRVDLFVTGNRQEANTISLGFRVKDTGIGIKEEDLDKLFESFTRLDETRNRNIEGTGLGMAIVTKLLDMMGSKLEVKSEYGVGSEFSFEVVQQIEDASPIGDFKQRLKEAAEKTDDETYVYAPTARLLAVDDNSMNLKVIKNLLKQNGIVPDMAESGEAALKLLASGTYDMVLLDHMMPHMDGIETLQKAKEKDLIPDITTVIALTANAVVGARETYLAAGFDDYLSKPVEIKALEEALSKYLPADIVEYRKHSDKPVKEAEAQVEVIEFAPDVTNDNVDVIEFEPETVAEEALEFAPSGETTGHDDASGLKLRDIDRQLNDNGIITQDGMGYCGGDEDFYLEILSDYSGSLEERRSELEEALGANDMEMYAIKVHSLKSTAKTVGDAKVFKMAQELETAAKENNSEFVGSNHTPLLAEYEAHAVMIAGLLEQ